MRGKSSLKTAFCNGLAENSCHGRRACSVRWGHSSCSARRSAAHSPHGATSWLHIHIRRRPASGRPTDRGSAASDAGRVHRKRGSVIQNHGWAVAVVSPASLERQLGRADRGRCYSRLDGHQCTWRAPRRGALAVDRRPAAGESQWGPRSRSISPKA